jgi:hypothetical protein
VHDSSDVSIYPSNSEELRESHDLSPAVPEKWVMDLTELFFLLVHEGCVCLVDRFFSPNLIGYDSFGLK